MPSPRHDLDTVRQRTSAAEWQRRQAVADAHAAIAKRIEARIAAGEPERVAIRTEAPEDVEITWVGRLWRYRAEGRDGLVPRRLAPVPKRKLTLELRATIRGILLVDPSLRSSEVHGRLVKSGVAVSLSVVKRAMRAEGLAHPHGPAGHRRQQKTEPLMLAGAELLKALDEEVGATRELTRNLRCAMEGLEPPPEGVSPDPGPRDEHGRFLPEYNRPQPRTEPELGEKFDSVDIRRKGKNLPAMRTANSSEASLHRKVLALVMLPCVTDSPRWSALRHWQGDALEGLVGIAYQPATLDKFLRELKYGGMSRVASESVAAFWLGQEALLSGPLVGAAVLYIDTSTKPVWTHHFSRCTKVSKRGRVMPATSTVFLHGGCGTPLLYESWSGQVSMPGQVGALLDRYEALAGPDTARRLVVMDREAHAAWLFKALSDRGWDFIIPLRSNVTGEGADFKALTPWRAYGEHGDQLRGGQLRLRDSRTRDEFIDVRVVGRKRHRTGKVAWYATRADRAAFEDAIVLDLYFERWPLQEGVFRDASGRVHLGAHYGYGKRKVDNIAVLDKIDKLDGKLRRLDDELSSTRSDSEELALEVAATAPAVERATQDLSGLRLELDKAVASGKSGTARFRRSYCAAQDLESCLQQAHDVERRAVSAAETTRREVVEGRDQLSRRRRIFTMDTELDQIMTAFKLTFVNLCALFQSLYLGGSRLQLDTLIRGLLTLPGERVTTLTTETIRLYRHSRDRELMPLVEEACKRLSHKKLRRNRRLLRFELVDRPDP